MPSYEAETSVPAYIQTRMEMYEHESRYMQMYVCSYICMRAHV
jgi:hypothetical protein